MWRDNSDNETGFSIESRVVSDTNPDAEFEEIATVEVNENSAIITDFESNKNLQFRIRALSNTNSEFSNTTEILT